MNDDSLTLIQSFPCSKKIRGENPKGVQENMQIAPKEERMSAGRCFHSKWKDKQRLIRHGTISTPVLRKCYSNPISWCLVTRGTFDKWYL